MNYKKLLLFFLLFLISLVPLLDLFHPGLPITHDGQDHVARIANFYKNLTDGNLIPRWAPNLNWGYGHPVLMFLYPVPSYTSSLVHLLGFSLVDSIKITFGTMFILSGIAMYLWAREAFNEQAGFLAAILYMFTPYRFIDLYVRGAIGEHSAFVFLPLVLYFFLKLTQKISFFYVVGGSLSLAGLILSHNAISLMFLPIILFYAFYLIFLAKTKKNIIINFFYILVFGFILSAFFWVPAFFEGRYTLRNIVTAGGYLNNFIEFTALFYGKWSFGGSGQFSIQLGIINILFSLLSVFVLFYLYKKEDKKFLFLLFIIFYFLLTIFLMSKESNIIWQKILILQNFQFPWRFLSVTVFATSVFGAIFLIVLPKKIQISFLIILCAAILYINKDYWHANNYLYKPENFYTNIYNGTTDTGESAPIWSIRFMEKRPLANVEIIEGDGAISEIKRETSLHVYKIIANKDVRIRENTLYFPGWKVLDNGKKVPIEFQDQKNRGLITYYIPKGEHEIKIVFEETKLRLFADYLSLSGIITIMGLWIFSIKNKKYGKK
ncbi:hypothetical protein C4559_03355 [Candidatus Microgenomates bacterium]|nr:MAG: hypothetical protein C4559_03355 [Candidatus Microgenomates bacterium]